MLCEGLKGRQSRGSKST